MPLFDPSNKSGFQTAWSATTDVLAGNSITEQSLMTATAQGSRVIPANFLQPGRTVRIIINGVYDAALTPGNVTIKVKLGSTVVATGTASALLSLAGNVGMQITATLAARVAGASGKVQAAGAFAHGISGSGRLFIDLNSVTDAVIDTTQDQLLDVTATWTVTGSKLTAKTGTVEMLMP